MDEGWWREPAIRMYWELDLVDGRREIVFHDPVGDAWFKQAYPGVEPLAGEEPGQQYMDAGRDRDRGPLMSNASHAGPTVGSPPSARSFLCAPGAGSGCRR